MSMLASLASAAFGLGFAWAVVGSRMANAERRLDEIEASHVAETRWQVLENTAAIAALRSDARRTEAEVAQIDTRLGVIEAKLDSIAESLRHRRENDQ